MNTPTYRLLCPGPVNVDPEVANALSSAEFCHREEEFEALLDQVRTRLLSLANLSPARWEAVVLTGSGTAANEAVISSAVPAGSRVLAITNGEFGERLAAIADLYHQVERVTHRWGDQIDLRRVDAALEDFDPDLVVMVHHETSTGMLNPVEQVGARVKNTDARLFVDGVSSFSADALDLDAAHVSFMSTSSGKALASYPGLSVVFGTHTAFRACSLHPRPTQYLDLFRYYDFLCTRKQTPNTPAIPLLLALDRAAANIQREGAGERRKRLAFLAASIRTQLRGLGLELLLDDSVPQSSVVVTAKLPDGVGFEEVRLGLRDLGFVVYGGKGPLVGRVIQVATIGAVDSSVIHAFTSALSRVLSDVMSTVSRRAI